MVLVKQSRLKSLHRYMHTLIGIVLKSIIQIEVGSLSLILDKLDFINSSVFACYLTARPTMPTSNLYYREFGIFYWEACTSSCLQIYLLRHPNFLAQKLLPSSRIVRYM